MTMNQQLIQLLVRLEILVQKMEYGTLSCNVIINNGVPNLKTFYVVRSKRKRFPPKNKNDLTFQIKV